MWLRLLLSAQCLLLHCVPWTCARVIEINQNPGLQSCDEAGPSDDCGAATLREAMLSHGPGDEVLLSAEYNSGLHEVNEEIDALAFEGLIRFASLLDGLNEDDKPVVQCKAAFCLLFTADLSAVLEMHAIIIASNNNPFALQIQFYQTIELKVLEYNGGTHISDCINVNIKDSLFIASDSPFGMKSDGGISIDRVAGTLVIENTVIQYANRTGLMIDTIQGLVSIASSDFLDNNLGGAFVTSLNLVGGAAFRNVADANFTLTNVRVANNRGYYDEGGGAVGVGGVAIMGCATGSCNITIHDSLFFNNTGSHVGALKIEDDNEISGDFTSLKSDAFLRNRVTAASCDGNLSDCATVLHTFGIRDTMFGAYTNITTVFFDDAPLLRFAGSNAGNVNVKSGASLCPINDGYLGANGFATCEFGGTRIVPEPGSHIPPLNASRSGNCVLYSQFCPECMCYSYGSQSSQPSAAPTQAPVTSTAIPGGSTTTTSGSGASNTPTPAAGATQSPALATSPAAGLDTAAVVTLAAILFVIVTCCAFFAFYCTLRARRAHRRRKEGSGGGGGGGSGSGGGLTRRSRQGTSSERPPAIDISAVTAAGGGGSGGGKMRRSSKRASVRRQSRGVGGSTGDGGSALASSFRTSYGSSKLAHSGHHYHPPPLQQGGAVPSPSSTSPYGHVAFAVGGGGSTLGSTFSDLSEATAAATAAAASSSDYNDSTLMLLRGGQPGDAASASGASVSATTASDYDELNVANECTAADGNGDVHYVNMQESLGKAGGKPSKPSDNRIYNEAPLP